MFCPNCGSEVKDDDLFCGECGAKIERTEVPESEPVKKEAAPQSESVRTAAGFSDKAKKIIIAEIAVLVVLIAAFFYLGNKKSSPESAANQFVKDYNSQRWSKIYDLYNFEEDREMLIGTILSKVLLLVLLFYVILKKLHKEAEGIDRKLWVILFLISIESICMAFIFYELYNGKNQIWIISFYTLLLLMNVSIFEIYKKSIYSLKLEKENMIYEQQLKLLRNCTQDQMNSTALFQREQHDLKNKLLGIRSSMEKQNVQDAIRMIDGILEHGNMVDKAELEKIGNDIIDTILRFKYAKAIQKNIVVKIDGFAMQKLPILDEDLCVVLGNMLDNAIEASEKVTDRWINVSIGLRKNGLVIVVENSFDGIIKKNIHGNIISIKENKEHHGYGLKSIRKTVEKYDGELVVEIRGNIFRAVAFMTCIDYV